MSDESAPDVAPPSASAPATPPPAWQAIPSRQRRVLGVLMEKAKTTPDAYPMSIAGLVAGANQKSNRYPLMNLTPEQVEDELSVLRRIGAAAEVQGSGRVPRYRHYGHNWLGVKGAEAGVMIELLLRGQQTVGDLRVRASRFEPIPDQATLQTILDSLIEKKLVIALTPPGRGQLFTHNLYTFEELQALKNKVARGEFDTGEASDDESSFTASAPTQAHVAPAPVAPSVVPVAPAMSSSMSSSAAPPAVIVGEVERLRQEVTELRGEVATLRAELKELRDAILS